VIPRNLLAELAPYYPINDDEMGGCIFCCATPPGSSTAMRDGIWRITRRAVRGFAHASGWATICQRRAALIRLRRPHNFRGCYGIFY